jgi:hypothetical protein
MRVLSAGTRPPKGPHGGILLSDFYSTQADLKMLYLKRVRICQIGAFWSPSKCVEVETLVVTPVLARSGFIYAYRGLLQTRLKSQYRGHIGDSILEKHAA